MKVLADSLPAVPQRLARGGLRDGLYRARRGIRRPVRALRIVAHIGAGFVIAFFIGALFPLQRSQQPQHRPLLRRATRWWLVRLTRLLNLDIEVTGAPVDRPALYVSNHVSWLDIPVLGAAASVHFLSKAEVADWPLIGRLATAAGTLYIRRGHGQVRERARALAAHLDAGHAIAVFPEGTTTDGHDVRNFHAPLFAAATGSDNGADSAGHTVQPVAIRYLDAHGAPHALAPFIGDDEFHHHLWRLLGEERIRVRVHFLAPLAGAGRDHKAVAAEAHAGVRAAVTGLSVRAVA